MFLTNVDIKLGEKSVCCDSMKNNNTYLIADSANTCKLITFQLKRKPENNEDYLTSYFKLNL